MHEIPLLAELAIMAAVGVVVSALLSRLRLPTVAGLLAAGALLGPFGLGRVGEASGIETLAEVGVVLLLFTIGLEFSVARFTKIFRSFALGGALQVSATIGATAGVALAVGMTLAQSVFIGFVVAMSSTAIVLRLLGDRGELDAPHGRFIVGTLIFQDLCVVPMVLLVPVLSSRMPWSAAALATGVALGKAALLVTGALLVARIVVPRLLRWVDASRSRESFLLAILAICVGTTWLASLAGVSLALGAFVGGMVVADSDFQHRAMGDMLPLRDAFVSVFFISLGMLFDGRLLLARPLAVGLLLLGFLAAKGALATLSALVMHLPARAAWLAGVGLGQFGEFGFVLIRLGQGSGLVDRETGSVLLAAGILSMFLVPLLLRLAPRVTFAERVLAPLARRTTGSALRVDAEVRALADHVVVVGYGVAGRLVAQALGACGLDHVVLDLNAETVRRARAAGEPLHYADATSSEALSLVRVGAARAVVVLINDPAAALRVVDTARRVAPAVPVIVRNRYWADHAQLVDLGATEVVTEEVEASAEVVIRLLRQLEVPRNVIEEQVRAMRQQLQTSRRNITLPRSALADQRSLSDLKIDSVLVEERGAAVGRTAREIAVRERTRALIVAVRRGDELLDHPDPDEPFCHGDVVYLVGSGAAIRQATALFAGSPRPGA
ncbi:MAG: cation:proton antiporter [Proteobacteria bacterium]|nr:cation:proton antiporter [Pseudomonadota bacterium]